MPSKAFDKFWDLYEEKGYMGAYTDLTPKVAPKKEQPKQEQKAEPNGNFLDTVWDKTQDVLNFVVPDFMKHPINEKSKDELLTDATESLQRQKAGILPEVKAPKITSPTTLRSATTSEKISDALRPVKAFASGASTSLALNKVADLFRTEDEKYINDIDRKSLAETNPKSEFAGTMLGNLASFYAGSEGVGAGIKGLSKLPVIGESVSKLSPATVKLAKAVGGNTLAGLLEGVGKDESATDIAKRIALYNTLELAVTKVLPAMGGAINKNLTTPFKSPKTLLNENLDELFSTGTTLRPTENKLFAEEVLNNLRSPTEMAIAKDETTNKVVNSITETKTNTNNILDNLHSPEEIVSSGKPLEQVVKEYESQIKNERPNSVLNELNNDSNVISLPTKESALESNVMRENMTQNTRMAKETINFDSITKIEHLPNDAEGLKAYVDEAMARKDNGFKIDLQLFSEAQKRLQQLSKLRTNTLSKAEFLKDPATQQALDDINMLYEVKPNAESLKKAQEMLDNNYTETYKRITNGEINTAEDTAAFGLILREATEKAKQSGDYSEMQRIVLNARESYTDMGQAIQALKTLQTDTPEGMVMKAQKVVNTATKEIETKSPKKTNKSKEEAKKVKEVIDQAADDVSKDVDKNIDKILDKTRKNNGTNQATENVKKGANKNVNKSQDKTKQNNGKNQSQNKNKVEKTPEEILAEKINRSLTGPKKEKDVVQQMIDELYAKYKETLPEGAIVKEKPNKIKEIAKAIKERRISADVWKKAKEIVIEKFKDDPEKLAILEEYFGKGTKPPFAKETLTKAVNQAMKELDIKIGDIVKKYYSSGNIDRKKLVDYIVKESGLTEEDAMVLAKYVQKEMKNKIKEYSEKFKENLFKEKVPLSSKSKIENSTEYLEAISNTGTFLDERYNSKVLEKLTPKLKSLIRESGVKMNELVKQGRYETNIEKASFVSKLMITLKINMADARKIANAANDVFYQMAKQARENILNNMLKQKVSSEPKTVFDKVMELINLDAYSNQKIVDLIKEKNRLPVLNENDIESIVKFTDKAKEYTPESYEYRMWMSRANKVMADKISPTLGEKIRGLQRISLLTNPKTIVTRNPLGNIILYAFENLKDIPGTIIDALTSKTLNTERTTLFIPKEKILAQYEGAIKGIKEWAKDVKNKVDTSPSRGQLELPKGRVFDGEILNTIDNITRNMLQLGDRPFYEAAYNSRIKELLKIKKTDVITKEIDAEAKLYALDRVFQNDSKIAESAKNLKKSLGILGDITMPFTQTPANVLDKLIDYSPGGFVKAIRELGRIKDGTFNQKIFVDRLARSLTGSGLAILGYVMTQKGLVTGGQDKNTNAANFKQSLGKTNYAFKLGDRYYTFDWAQPIAGALAIGADYYNGTKNKEEFLNAIWGGLEGAGNSLIRQSMFKGVLYLFSSYSPVSGVGKSMLGSTTQLTPTASKQLSQMFDPYVRETYDPNLFKQTFNKTVNRIPFASMTLPAKVDSSGDEILANQGENLFKKFFDVFFSPGMITRDLSKPIQNEILRVYDSTGDTGVIPPTAEKTIKFEKKSYQLSPKQYTQYQKVLGKMVGEAINEIDLNGLSDEDKAKEISSAISKAKRDAKEEMLSILKIK